MNFLKSMTFVLLLSIVYNHAVGQSSDRVRYYILYDVSGSKKTQDRNANIDQLLDHMIDFDENGSTNKEKLDSRVALSVHFVGEDIQNVKQQLDIYSSGTIQTKQRNDLISTIQDFRDTVNVQDYTHIHDGLNDILNLDPLKWKETFGVFIVTDGQLRDGDINIESQELGSIFNGEPTITQYLERVRKQIKKLEDQNKPVFVIQSSPDREGDTTYNDYFHVHPAFSKQGLDGAYFRNDRVFWVDSGMKLKVRSDSSVKVLDAFNQFLMDAQMSIINGNRRIYKDTTKYIPKVIRYLDLIASLKRFVGNSSFEEKSAPYRELINQYMQLKTELDGLKGTVDLHKIDSLTMVIKGLIRHDSMQLVENMMREVALEEKLPAPSSFLSQKYGKSTQTLIPTNEQPQEWSSLQEAIVTGLANYVIKRSEQEVIHAFFDTVLAEILENSTFLKDHLFQNLYGLLKEQHQTLSLVLVRDAIEEDLRNMPSTVLEHPNLREKEELVALMYTLKLFNALLQHGELEGAFNHVNTSLINDHQQGSWNARVRPFHAALLFSTEIVKYLKDNNLQDAYRELTSPQLKNLSDMILLHFSSSYRNGHLSIYHEEEISETIKEFYSKYDLVRQEVSFLNKELKRLEGQNGDFEKVIAYRKRIILEVMKSSAELFVSGAKLARFFRPDPIDDSNRDVARFVRYMKLAVETFYAFKQEDYSRGVSLLLPLLPQIAPDSMSSQKISRAMLKVERSKGEVERARMESISAAATIKKAMLAAEDVNSDPTSSDTARKAAADRIDKEKNKKLKVDRKAEKAESKWDNRKKQLDWLNADYPVQYKKVIALSGEVVEARSAEEIESLIFRYALPVASYRLKRESSALNIMINAYAGVNAAVTTSFDDWEPMIAAPIGLDFSKSIKPKHQSLSLFFPLLDVGNMINHELGGNEDESGDILLKQIVSPGVMVSWGVSGKFPIAFIGGFQLNPDRFSVGIALDLPMFKLK